MFTLGKLYQIKRPEAEEDIPFKAGNLSRPFRTASGGIDYDIILVEDGSILMFVGVKTIDLPLCDENECYVFWYEESLVMLKKSDVQKRNYLRRITG